jgi:hypothetical protein
MLTEKSNRQLSEVAKYVQKFKTSNLSIEVPPNDDEELNRVRLDELLFELDNLDLSVERILFYSTGDHLSDDLKTLAAKSAIRLTIEEVIEKPNITPIVENISTLEKKETTEIEMPKWAKPVVDYKNNIKKFIINNYTSSKLKTADGSFIKIEAESFVFLDGSIVSTPIEIETKFAKTKNIAILDELTTTFGDKILESRGMMYVNATSNGKQLKLAEGKELEINIKTKAVENDFQAFQGIRNTSNGNMDWLLDDKIINIKKSTNKYKYYKYEKISAEKRAEFVAFRNEQIQHWQDLDVSKKKIKARLKSADQFAKRRDKQKKEYYKKRSNYTTNDDRFYSNKRLRKKDYDLVKKSAKNNPNRYSKKYKIGVPRYEFVEYENKSRWTPSFYAMNSRSLGWCNIDRVLEFNKEKPPCDLIVKASKNENIKIVFDNYFVVLRGMPHKDGFIFKNLPQGLGITVLSANKLDDGNIKFAKTKTELSNKTINLSDYSTISSEDFTTFIEKLTV